MLKNRLIRLGHVLPKLRPHLRVLIAHEEFQELFGELRSLLAAGKRDKATYKGLLSVLTRMDRIHSGRTMSEVVPYVERALRQFPDEVRTYGEVTLTTLGKPESKYKLLFAKVYTGRKLNTKLLKTRGIAEKVLLQTRAADRLINLDLSQVPLTNKEVIQAANKFGQKVMTLFLNDRDLPPDTLKHLKSLPSYSLHIEGNPRIDQKSIRKLKEDQPELLIQHDNPNEVGMAQDELYAKVGDYLRGMFEARDTLEWTEEGAPIVRGTFGSDAKAGRSGAYRVELMPVEESDTTVKFKVHARGDAYDHASIETFPLPRIDLQNSYGGNRFISKIIRSLNNLLYDVMTGRG